MSKFGRSFLILFFICGVSFMLIVGLGFFLLIGTLDGKEYRSNDVLYYYVLTPGLFRQLPHISEDIIFNSKADDNYGYSKDSIIWSNVTDVPAADSTLRKYFRHNGFTERNEGIVWSSYWSDVKFGVCPSEQYTIVWGYHSIGVELITGAAKCREIIPNI